MFQYAKAEQNEFQLIGDIVNHIFMKTTYTRKMIELLAFVFVVCCFLA